jgi:hypothetical protein
MRGIARWSFVTVSVVASGLAGCQMAGAPMVDPAVAGMGCEQAETFAFSGETSLAAIGLGENFGMGPDSSRIGMIWVTAEAVNMNGPGPAPPGMAPQIDRMVCVQWPDGSGMSGPVPPDWEPPNVFDAAAAPDEGPPLTLIGLVVAALVIVGVSFLAFSERRPAA